MALSIYTKTCSKNIAGNNAVFLTEASNIASVTVDASGEITAITMDGASTFKQLQADQDSILRIEDAAGNDSSISYTHSVQMGFAKGSVDLNTLRDSLSAASPCGIIAIVQDANGKSWLVGYNEVDGTKRALRLIQDNYGSGNSPADEDVQKADVVLESISGYADLPFDSTLNASIIAALAAGGGTAIELAFINNMVANGSFDTDTLWAKDANWTIAGGVAVYAGTVSGAQIKQSDADMLASIQPSTDYTLAFDVIGAAPTAVINITNYAANVGYIGSGPYANGSHSIDFTTPASILGGGLLFAGYLSGTAFDLDNVVLTER